MNYPLCNIPHIHYHVIFRKKGDVENPIGGIRNVIPWMGNYKNGNVEIKAEEVLKWTKELKKIL